MKYALITGGSSGIGAGFAREYARRGCSLILVARSKAKLDTLAFALNREHSVDVQVVELDLAQIGSARQLFDICRRSGWEIDCLINNAGFGWIGNFEKQEYGKLEQMMILNMVTLTELVYLFLPQLKESKGTLINVSSRAAFQPIPYLAAYAASKSYVLSLTEALSSELKKSGVAVMALAPGATHTEFFKVADPAKERELPNAQTVEEVISEAMKGLAHHKGVVVSGRWNRMLNLFIKILPRSFVLKLTRFAMEKWG